jgi:hypothetical protein
MFVLFAQLVPEDGLYFMLRVAILWIIASRPRCCHSSMNKTELPLPAQTDMEERWTAHEICADTATRRRLSSLCLSSLFHMRRSLVNPFALGHVLRW